MSLTDKQVIKDLDHIFLQIISRQLSAEALTWLKAKAELVKNEEKSIQLNMAFAHLPRFSSKAAINIEPEESKAIAQLLPGFKITHWALDRLCRVWLLMQVPADHQDVYFKKINGLFTASEMNEQIALYSALALFHYPEIWVSRCEEGIRSNIGTVLEAIMYHNPYPAAFLSEAAWNQLILKAFFTEKDVNLIVGLHERLNKALADTLNDYVQERLAAHRTVLPEIYKLIEETKEKI
ncbi:EboA domain-containing protein [Pedobacter frigoris]|uniref:EboA domain-containing protein n=1 Tax=Pedobacter frigoris TaxID=2571272 RepID=UPI00292FA53A|nr:EboA domain-containing protein [Pedobacter frigoris]